MTPQAIRFASAIALTGVSSLLFHGFLPQQRSAAGIAGIVRLA